MSSDRDMLVQDYAQHYARVNAGAQSKAISDKMARGFAWMYEDLLKPLPLRSRVLDLGCGTGTFVRWLSTWPNLHPVGVDGSATQAERAAQLGQDVEIRCEDGLAFLKRNSNSFAGVFCLDVLEHIPGTDLLLEWAVAIREALNPGGFFCCRVPNGANFTASHMRYMDLTHERLFTSDSLIQLLNTAGFQNVSVGPVKSANLAGRVRGKLEDCVHRCVFRLCGRGRERVFSYDLSGIARR